MFSPAGSALSNKIFTGAGSTVRRALDRKVWSGKLSNSLLPRRFQDVPVSTTWQGEIGLDAEGVWFFASVVEKSMKAIWRGLFCGSLILSLSLFLLYSCMGRFSGEIFAEAATGAPARKPRSALLLVLGNMPLDESTPTLDTMTRVRTAVDYYKKSKDGGGTWIVFSGGPTAGGKVSEALTMKIFAQQLGVNQEDVILEERARTTEENAIYTASLLLERGLRPQALKEIYIVSKNDHLEWAMPLFKQSKKVPGAFFENAKPMGCNVDRLDSIRQMEKYLQSHPDSKMVALRLKNLRNGIRGID